MNTRILIQIIINGIALGAVYALISTGFSIIFNILKFSNFSHGALMTLSAFVGYYACLFFRNQFAIELALPVVLLICMVVGGLVAMGGELVAFRRITKANTSPIYFFVASITLGTFFEGLVTLWAGANFYGYPRFFEKANLKLLGLSIRTSDLIMLLSAIGILVALTFIIQKTKLGRGLRAVSFDRDTAGLMGINVTRVIQFAFFLSGSLAGISGVFLGINYSLTTTMGSLVVKGFIASVIGGLGSMTGAIIGAVLLGIVETLLNFFLGTGYKEVIVLVIMLVFLLVHPQGIAGTNIQEKA
ncbi:MAG: branched-chain amino acid ABC transporter permease [Clostridia bacterium]